MQTAPEIVKAPKSLNVLLIGNNPIEMENILASFNKIRTTRIVTEVAFNLKTTLERLIHFKPNYILIDDNLGNKELNQAVKKLASNKHTKNIPVTVIKNSNYKNATVSSHILDYLMKNEISGEALMKAVDHSLKFKRTQLYLYNTYKKRRRQLLGIMK